MFTIEILSESTRTFVDAQIAESWAGPFVVTKGVLHDTRTHSGFIAVDNGTVVGYILYHLADGDCEITVLESVQERRGIGKALINAVLDTARKAASRRMWLITTNDNIHAIRFYQRFGFALRAVHIDSMDEARKLKPQIPLAGNDEIPIAHEFEFEMRF
jgi:ribosomal protein S18 acetylase RimI-like enzyme